MHTHKGFFSRNPWKCLHRLWSVEPACGSSDHSLIYFYPKADTPGCTKQACSTRESRADLAKAGVAYVGVSPDVPKKQNKFDEKYGLKFPLLADEDHAVSDAYGAWYGVKPKDTVPKPMEAQQR